MGPVVEGAVDADPDAPMKTPVALFILATSPWASADPGPAALDFLKVPGGTRIFPERTPFDAGKLPEGLAAVLPKLVMDDDAGKPPVPHSGFTFDLNKDGKSDYFVHVRYASGSGGPYHEVYSEIGGAWQSIMGFQGMIHVVPAEKGWPRLVTTSRGGGGHFAKLIWHFDGKKYRCNLIERFANGKITNEVPDWSER